ncbi:MAG TPA: RNA methyltransferase [Anaerolineales bacterium]|nr:RNA methyltransferase [Anaerolineales bacterium]
MSRSPITSPSNPLIKKVRALRQRKARIEAGLFIVEGLHHVGEALEAGWEIDSILYSPDVLTSGFGRDLISGYESKLQSVSVQVMKSLADKENPQGIIAVAHQRSTQLAALKSLQVGVAVVSPQDPGNVGTILRTLDAVGAEVLFLLDGGVDPYHPTSVRASMGTIFWKPIVQTSFAEFINWARDLGCQLIATSAHSQRDYLELSPDQPWVLVLGGEQKGLSAEQIQACHLSVSLPMRGRASSLNLAVAAGILLYYFTTRK